MVTMRSNFIIVSAAAALILCGCGGDLRRAQESYRVGDFARAQRLFESALDADPGSFEARFGYALVLQELSLSRKALGEDRLEDWTGVVKAYEICAKLGQVGSFADNYAIALFHLANKLYLQGKFSLAQTYLNQARSIDPKNKYVLNLAGIVAYSQGKYKEAQETFEYLLAVDPAFISAYLNLGNVLWESGQEDAALVTWKQALSLNPNDQAILKRVEAAIKKISGS